MRWLLLTMLALAVWPGKATPQESTDPSVALATAIQDYNAGHVSKAITDAQSAYEQSKGSLNATAAFSFVSNILDLCAGAYNADCMGPRIEELLEIRPSVPSFGELVDAELDNQIGRHIGDFVKLSFDPEWMKMWLERWFEPVPENPFNPSLYVQRQLLAARFYQTLDRNAEAQRARQKALSMIASLQNPSMNSWNIGVAIMEVLLQTVQTDPVFANNLYWGAGDFAARSLPDLSPEKTLFRVVESELLTHQGDLGAIKSSREAIRLLEKSEIASHMRDFMLIGIHNQLIVVCVLSGENACVDEAIREHPYTERFDANHNEPITHYQEVQYLAVRVVGELALGRTPPPHLRALLRAPLDFIEDETSRRAHDLYRQAAAVGWQNSEKVYPSVSDAIRFAEGVIEHANGGFGKTPTTFPMVGMIDRLIVALASSGLRTSEATGDHVAELHLQLAELYNRNIRQADAESMKIIARGKDDEQRRDLQTWQRLNSRAQHEYILAMRRIVERAQGQIDGTIPIAEADIGPSGNMNLRDFSVRQDFAKFDRLSRNYAERAGLVNALEGANDLPTLDEIQQALDSTEVFVTTVAAAGYISIICVTRDQAFVEHGTFNAQQTFLDYKLISAALSSGHAPNDELDSQFPVAAARRYYDLLIRPIEQCLEDKSHLIWAPDNAIAGLPMAILLSTEPDTVRTGYSLRDANWLINRVGISYVLSARAFLASNAVARTRVDVDGFLGVGDPKLDNAGSQQATALLRGAVPVASGSLSSLAALPDTADELQDIASGFGSDANLLLGEMATEASFRTKPIGEYEYIAFATHGLVREEIPGLAEAALVLTPNSTTDSMDDGLLQASEIADLSLNARLVALSACNTANYDYQYFDSEMTGLAAAFASAGVPATLATLWPVDSQTSRAIVASTFHYLRGGKGLSPAVALARAQRSFLNSPSAPAYAHPRFWAPFVVYGDGGARRKSTDRDTSAPQVHEFSSIGGEIEAMVNDDSVMYARGLGNMIDGRYESVVLRFEDGFDWVTLDRGLGSGRGVGVIGNSLVIDGFVGGGDTRGVSTLIWYNKETGNEEQRQSFPADDRDSFPLSIAISPDDQILVGTLEDEVREYDDRPPTIALRRLGPTGDIRASRQLEYPWDNISTSNSMHWADGSLLITTAYTNTLPDFDSANGELTDFDELRVCQKSARSYLYVVDPVSLNVIRRVDTSPYEIRDVVEVDNAVWAAGSRYSSCDVKPTLKLLEITSLVSGEEDAHIVELYSESPGEESQAMSVGVHGDRIVVAGHSIRVTGVAPTMPIDDIDAYLVNRVQFSPFTVHEGLVIEFNRAGRLVHRERLVGGSDVFLSSVGIAGDSIAVGGIYAGRSALATLEVSD